MSENSAMVEARIPKGFQDFLPWNIMPRKRLIAAIEEVLGKYGFLPVETPAIEHLDVLLGTGGEGSNKELFRLESPEGEPLAMRFDHTVPFARLLAQYADQLKTPFRRYAIGPVWRADKPGPGRFRQFVQLDIDAAGSQSVMVDGEIISIMCDVMAALKVPDYQVLFNDRKLINALLEECGIHEAERQKHVLRVIDKLAKVGVDNVRLELGEGRIDDSGDPIPGVHLDTATIDKLVDFIAIEGESRAAVLAAVAEQLGDGACAQEAIDEVTQLVSGLDALGVPEAHARFVPSLTRGLDYYTGPVFETVLPGAPEFGSVMGGGRYNELVSRFLERPIPCTGMSVGLDRLFAALVHCGVAPEARTSVEALVVRIGKVPEVEAIKVAGELRASGICAEAYLGTKRNLKAQLSYADRYGVPVAIILGEDEVAQGVVAIKDLLAGKVEREGIQDHQAYRKAGKTGQVTVARTEMAATVCEMLTESA